jgi:hypothetical protein
MMIMMMTKSNNKTYSSTTTKNLDCGRAVVVRVVKVRARLVVGRISYW